MANDRNSHAQASRHVRRQRHSAHPLKGHDHPLLDDRGDDPDHADELLWHRQGLRRAGREGSPRSRRAPRPPPLCGPSPRRLRSGPAPPWGDGSPRDPWGPARRSSSSSTLSLVCRVTLNAHREPTGRRPRARGRPPPRPTTPQVDLVRRHALRRPRWGRPREHLIRGVCGRPVIPQCSGLSRPVSPHPEASPPCGRCARWGAARLAASSSTGGAPLPGARWEGGGENVVPTARSGRPPCAVRRVRHALEPIARRVTMGGWLTCWRRCIPLTFRSHGRACKQGLVRSPRSRPLPHCGPRPPAGQALRLAFASRAGQRFGRSPQPRGAARPLGHGHRVPSSASGSDRTSWPTVAARSGSGRAC